MTQRKIYLNTIEDIKAFIELTKQFPGDIDIISGHITVDGKSILGLYSLDISKPLNVRYIGYDENKFYEAIKDFLIED